MRGKAADLRQLFQISGITPAYAGKSCSKELWLVLYKDHPRVCGEKGKLIPFYVDEVGSPPRMRGKETGSVQR